MISKSGELTQLQSDVQCGHIGHDDSDAETISALKAQIQICTEDFESERRDREKAQNRVTELETELSQYNRVVRFTFIVNITEHTCIQFIEQVCKVN